MKISIITVCYNSEKTIKDTLESVLSQTYDNYEYIIIDGKSTDSTLDIINSYIPKFKGKVVLSSEKDKGLYDAMNKGVKKATGDIIGILNSDDVLANKNIFKDIVESYKDDTDIIYGDVLYYDEELKNIKRDYISGENKSLAWCPAHPSMYVRKKVFEEAGLYDLTYKVAADFDFMVRLNKKGYKFQYLKEYIVHMRLGGASNGIKGYIHDFTDSCKILKHNKVSFPVLRTFGRVVKTLKQIIKK